MEPPMPPDWSQGRPPMPPTPPFTLFQMPLWQTLYDPMMFWMLMGLVVLTLIVDTLQRISLRLARGDRCLTSFVNRLVAELMLFGMAAVTIMTMYEATARQLATVIVDQLHWVDVYVSVSAILLILVGVWAWLFVVRPKSYYKALMNQGVDVTQAGLELEVAGGYISQLLAREFGLGTTYSFGLYVREITAAGIVDLIDVNMLGWIGFTTPAIVGLIASYNVNHVYAPLDMKIAQDSIRFVVLYGWFWLLLSVALHAAGMVGTAKLRTFYGISNGMSSAIRDKVLAAKEMIQSQKTGEQHSSASGAAQSSQHAAAGGGAGDVELAVKSARLPASNDASYAPRSGTAMFATMPSNVAEANRQWLQSAQELTQSLSAPAVAYLSGKGVPNESDQASMLSVHVEPGEYDLSDWLGREPLRKIWLARNLWWLKQLLQVVMLNMCGQIAGYVLTVHFHIDDSGLGGEWHFLALFPPFFILFVLLPWTCKIYAQFEAYAVPRADILDNVISDEDERAAHQEYLKDRLTKRREEAERENSHVLFNRLRQFERTFTLHNHACSRYCNAWLDIMRGVAENYTAESECFFTGMLEVAKVPCSRERLDLLVPWVKEELGGSPPTIERIFEIIGVEPPPKPGSHRSQRA